MILSCDKNVDGSESSELKGEQAKVLFGMRDFFPFLYFFL